MDEIKNTIAGDSTSEPVTGEAHPEKKKSKRKKTLLWGCLGCAGVSLLLIACLIGVLVWVFSSIFSEKPFPLVTRTPDSDALASATAKFQTALTGGGNGDVEALAAMLNGQQPNASAATGGEKEVTIDTRETNALIDSSLAYLHGQDLSGNDSEMKLLGMKLQIADAIFENGVFKVKASLKGADLGFGAWINADAEFIPGIKDRHFVLKMRKLKVGSMDFPPDSFKETVDKELLKFESTDDGKQILDLVSSVEVKEDGVTMKYDPGKLIMFILQKLSVLGGGDILGQ